MADNEHVTPKTKEQKKREEIIAKRDNGEKLTEEDINYLKYYQEKDENEQIDRIIRGVNDVFEKHYDFQEEWKIEFDIAIKAPNALEQGKIQARREAYLEGMGLAVSPFIYQCYQTLATIRVCGTKIPKELARDEDIYNLNVLYRIGQDYGHWLNSFRL